jgi:hypothetical protein
MFMNLINQPFRNVMGVGGLIPCRSAPAVQ